MRRGPVLLSIATLLGPALARAQAVPTWGASPDASSSVLQPAPAAPPEPPPATLGTPVPGSTSAPSSPPVTEAVARAVRPPVGLGPRYTLEGLEVRGNTTTLSRVVLRYVPFHAGDVIDVDDRSSS